MYFSNLFILAACLSFASAIPADMSMVEARDTLWKRASSCYNPDYNGLAQTGNVRSCADYLNAKGTTACAVPSGKASTFCTAGDAKIIGQNPYGGSASSYCLDVAATVYKLINDCTTNGRTGGFEFARGNGNLIIAAKNINS